MSKFKAFVLFMFFATFLTVAFSKVVAQEQLSTSTKGSTLSLQKQVGQLFILGFNGSSSTDDLRNVIRRYAPGGLIVFGKNIKSPTEIKNLISFAQQEAKQMGIPPLFIAVDQEGGVVSRIKTFPPLPSALSVGNANLPELTRRLGYLVGTQLKSLGFNMNLAPVLDLADLHIMSFIGNRSFGVTPENVATHAKEMSLGFLEAGVIPTSKHFPGHGNLTADSHKTLPTKPGSFEDLKVSDLVPFQSFFDIDGPKAVMVAHLTLPGVDPTGTPATFSKAILTDLLRDKLKYDGLIVTDDLEMQGAKSATAKLNHSSAVQSILAGADLVMVAWNRNSQREAIQSVLESVQSQTISEERLQRSLSKILKYKEEINLSHKSKASPFDQKNFNIELRKVTDKIIFTNLMKSVADNISLSKNIKKFNELHFISSDSSFYASFIQFKPRLKSHFYPLTNGFNLQPIANRLLKHKEALSIFVVNGRRSSFALKRIPESVSDKILVVNTDDPGLILDPQRYFGVINVSSKHPDLGRMFYSAVWDPQKRRVSWEQ